MTHIEPLILSLADIRAADLPLVGGKGANLGEMAHAGWPVPPGFCLTTAAFRQFIAAGPGAEKLFAPLAAVAVDDVEAVRRVGQDVRRMLLDVPMPDTIAAAALQAWRAIGADFAYAVRSSATAEDLPDASFAGQQDTYLNVRGAADLLDAIRRCWVSLFTDRAILYRGRNHFDHRDVALAVVVQKMIPSEIAGTLFTADPLTGHRHTLTIDASFGLGEALVSGLVSPDAYRVDKRTRRILDRRIADKQIAIVPAEGGGTRQERLDAARRGQTALSDDQILALADMGGRIEAHYGTPQDIEWAIAGGQLYLLQARPITSLYPLDGLSSPDGRLHIFFSLGHQQSMTRAMPPLSLSTLQVMLPVGHSESIFDNDIVRADGGRLFADITQPLHQPLLRRVVMSALGQLNALAPEAVEQVRQRPEFRRSPGMGLPWSFLRSLLPILRRVGSVLWKRDMTGFVERTNTAIDDFVAEVTRRLGSRPLGREQLQAVLAILPDVYAFILTWLPEAGAGMAASRLLTRLARRWLAADELNALTVGIPGNVVNEMNMAIGDLADVARRSPPLVEAFENLGDDAHAWLRQAAQLAGSGPFMAAWDDFLARYGVRGPSEIDIARPRWAEDPLPVLRVVGGFLQQAAGRHRAQQQALIRGREAAMQTLLARASGGLLGWWRVRVIKRLYGVMLAAGGLREHGKWLIVRLLAVIKEALQDTASQLVAAGKLAQADDLWFLTWRELLAIGEDEATDWGDLIARRRADLARYQKLTPPLIITSDGETPAVRYHLDDAPPGALLGYPVSPGIVEGVAHVIRDPQRETLAPGEILVAEFTDPGWTPLFINAGGLILEVGGALTHGAVVAREYGIPAVVGVREATSTLHTGQRVRVDGSRGVVEVM